MCSVQLKLRKQLLIGSYQIYRMPRVKSISLSNNIQFSATFHILMINEFYHDVSYINTCQTCVNDTSQENSDRFRLAFFS